MRKLTFAAMTTVLALGGPALAANETWLVTEENTSGVKGSQGTWTVNVEGSKLKGSADLQSGNGSSLTYNVEGEAAKGVYTVTMADRSDGKKGCVWSGHAPAGVGDQTHGLVGYAI